MGAIPEHADPTFHVTAVLPDGARVDFDVTVTDHHVPWQEQVRRVAALVSTTAEWTATPVTDGSSV